MSNTISAIRQEYLLASLQEEDTFDDPIFTISKMVSRSGRLSNR